jgi:predicted nucleotidyltransferase
MIAKPNIEFDRDKLNDLCQRWKVKRLAFFGSVLRDDFGPESDIDVLYEFEPDAVIGWYIVDFEEDLSRLFGGRKVDLVVALYDLAGSLQVVFQDGIGGPAKVFEHERAEVEGRAEEVFEAFAKPLSGVVG